MKELKFLGLKSDFAVGANSNSLSRRNALGAAAMAACGLALSGEVATVIAAENMEASHPVGGVRFRRRDEIEASVTRILANQPATDLHTHCYSPRFGSASGGLLSYGIDDLLTYHYLVAEVFRVVPATQLSYEQFWAMDKAARADHIWKHLFVERTPLSEACGGVLTTLTKQGLDPNEKDLSRYRKWYRQQDPNDYINKVMKLANVDQITMTNPVFDDIERAMWDRDLQLGNDPRFKPVLRCDQLLTDWRWASGKLAAAGYEVREDLSNRTIEEVKRWLRFWLDRMKAEYLAMSLPPEWRYPAPNNPDADRLLRECLLPVLGERSLAWALMIGVRRGVNPALKDAGDGSASADVQSVSNVCRDFPSNKFLVTMLARENQHELCVAGRKFGNLLVFGSWWFLNNPSLIEEITRMRLEMLGTTFVAQHSDARILDQLIYKWDHSRRAIGKVLTDKYASLVETGYALTEAQIQRDAARLLRDNYRDFVQR